MKAVLLLFSGGRDSTIAAVRLSRQFDSVHLLTVSSSHLYGIERVKERLSELKGLLSPASEWVHANCDLDMESILNSSAATCLPCHLTYVAVGARLAAIKGISSLGFGYVRYQSQWPEQTPKAVDLMRAELAKKGLSLELPAYSVSSKEEAQAELTRYGLSTNALEQKCERQLLHKAMTEAQLNLVLDQWALLLASALGGGNTLQFEILERMLVSNMGA